MDNRTLEEVRKNEDRLINELEQLQQENQSLKAKIKTYEDPNDSTLMFMYCEEKAKDKIKELKLQLEDKEERLERLRISAIGHAEKELDLENQQKEFISYLENEKDRLIQETSHYYTDSFDRQHAVNETIYDEVDVILSKYKEIIGGKE